MTAFYLRDEISFGVKSFAFFVGLSFGIPGQRVDTKSELRLFSSSTTYSAILLAMSSLSPEFRQPFGISVITSWWQPPVQSGNFPGPNMTWLPSVVETLEAGIRSIDYYFVGQGEEAIWCNALNSGEGEASSVEHVFEELATRSYATKAGSIRQLFQGQIVHGTPLSGYARVVALATHLKQVSTLTASWDDHLVNATTLIELLNDSNMYSFPSQGRRCPLTRLKAALIVATALGAGVVELVGGMRTDPVVCTNTDAYIRTDGPWLWADDTELMPDSARVGPSPQEILIENLFRLATFILTRLPAVKDMGERARPPVTLALEIEPGGSHILNSLDHYRSVRDSYRKRVDEFIDKLVTCRSSDHQCYRECLGYFQAFPRGIEPNQGAINTLRELYYDAVGLNVDVGHMMLLDIPPGAVSPVHWGGCQTDGSDDLFTRDIVHYHIADHRRAHFCDLPPGYFHSPLRFEPWIRQAYGLSQLLSEGSDSEKRIHPNFSRHMAIELEACLLGQDQIASTYVVVDRWLRRCIA